MGELYYSWRKQSRPCTLSFTTFNFECPRQQMPSCRRWFQWWKTGRSFWSHPRHWQPRSQARGSRYEGDSSLHKSHQGIRHRCCCTWHRYTGSLGCILSFNAMPADLDEGRYSNAKEVRLCPWHNRTSTNGSTHLRNASRVPCPNREWHNLVHRRTYKKTCWGVFVQHPDLLRGLGVGPVLSDHVLQDAESFFCKIYGANNADDIDEVRASMFVRGMTIERLPPTRDALYLHIRRSHYQTLVWRQAHLQYPILPQPEIMGWKMEGHYLVPKLTSLPPVPDACQELITCTCTTGCKTARCGCKPNPCTASCKCRRSSDTCMNQ